MAEERIETRVSPEKTNDAQGHELVRGATGKSDTPNRGVKILSRYLRASPSSCHDMCKYGTKHVFEAKARGSFLKMVTAKEGEVQVIDKDITSAERKKRLAISPKRRSDSKIQKPNDPLVTTVEVSSSTEEETAALEKVSSPAKEIDISVDNGSDQNLKLRQSKTFSLPAEGSNIQRNNEIREGRESPRCMDSSRKSRKPIITRNEWSTSKIVEKKARVLPAVYSFPKHSVKRVSSVNTNNGKDAIKVKGKQLSIEDVPEKTLHIIEESTVKRTVEPCQNHVHITNLSPSPEDKSLKHAPKGIRSSRLPPSSEKNNLRSNGTGVNVNSSPPSSSVSFGSQSLRNKRFGTHIARSSLSLLSLSSTSLFPPEPSNSKEHGANISGSEDQVANAKVKYKSGPKRGGRVSSGNKVFPAQKVKFFRGKMVELRSENSTPRRLKFRGVRLLGETQNTKDDTRKSSIWRKQIKGRVRDTTLKSGEDFQRRCSVGGTSRRSSGSKEDEIGNGTETKSQKVVLRHQFVEGKKDAGSLYNNVIEETANKLVVTRKSKVKALVGAFETVISLQDNRSSGRTIKC